jgi:hypothetical protein
MLPYSCYSQQPVSSSKNSPVIPCKISRIVPLMFWESVRVCLVSPPRTNSSHIRGTKWLSQTPTPNSSGDTIVQCRRAPTPCSQKPVSPSKSSPVIPCKISRIVPLMFWESVRVCFVSPPRTNSSHIRGTKWLSQTPTPNSSGDTIVQCRRASTPCSQMDGRLAGILPYFN